jgi:hypothetical protein
MVKKCVLTLITPQGGHFGIRLPILFEQGRNIVVMCRNTGHEVINQSEPQGTHSHDIRRPVSLESRRPMIIARRLDLRTGWFGRIVKEGLLHDPGIKGAAQDLAFPHCFHNLEGYARSRVEQEAKLVACFVANRSSMKPPPGKVLRVFAQHGSHDRMRQQKVDRSVCLGIPRP